MACQGALEVYWVGLAFHTLFFIVWFVCFKIQLSQYSIVRKKGKKKKRHAGNEVFLNDGRAKCFGTIPKQLLNFSIPFFSFFLSVNHCEKSALRDVLPMTSISKVLWLNRLVPFNLHWKFQERKVIASCPLLSHWQLVVCRMTFPTLCKLNDFYSDFLP